MPTRTEAIQRFLNAKTHSDLAKLYNLNMECQVNVAQDGGYRIDKEYKGRGLQAWTDGLQTWKSFRIPHNAATEPEYTDFELTFDLEAHVEGIGMTGWDWKNRLSRWVGFDFDSITGHSDKHPKGLSPEELLKVQNAAIEIPWITVRKSTGGKGLHLYVHMLPVLTKNHTEHAALGRAILGKLSALTGFDFNTKVDTCGGNMWVWHRKMTPESGGLSLLKQGDLLPEPPLNWQDHITVITGKRPRTAPLRDGEQKSEAERLFDEIVNQRPKIPLDEDHKRLLKYLLEENRTASYWDQDHHTLVTHTYQLNRAYEELGMRGVFKTLADHDENGTDKNCFAFPMRRGAWSVRRYGLGVGEAETWTQDSSGYTRCFLNHDPDLDTVARANGGLERPEGGYQFQELEIAMAAVQQLGHTITLDNSEKWATRRKATLKAHKDGRLIVEFARQDEDVLRGWIAKKDRWQKVINVPTSAPIEQETGNYDDLVRHIVTETGEDYGWVVKGSSNEWNNEPYQHVKVYLKAQGLNAKETEILLGQSVTRAWRLVNIPFKEEYPGDRRWNRVAAQLKHVPNPNYDNLNYTHWMRVLTHCGVGLDHAIGLNGWCQANGITSGADYLKVWFASLFQEPLEPLPYLFLWGEQDSGKSVLHEAFSLLVDKGYQRADASLINPQGFNAELEGAVLCVIEETNLNTQKGDAYNRIKDWVTARQLPIHKKGKTPYHVPNTTHWIQCNNDKNACPIFPGDTRITMINVPSIDPLDLIPKRELLTKLNDEAPDFLAALLQVEIPPPTGRLNVPVITTEDKISVQKNNRNSAQVFFEEKCFPCDGNMVLYSEIWTKFQEWVDASEAHIWTQKRFGKEIPTHYIKGRSRKDNQINIGNISLTPCPAKGKKIVAVTDEKGQTYLV